MQLAHTTINMTGWLFPHGKLILLAFHFDVFLAKHVLIDFSEARPHLIIKASGTMKTNCGHRFIHHVINGLRCNSNKMSGEFSLVILVVVVVVVVVIIIIIEKGS